MHTECVIYESFPENSTKHFGYIKLLEKDILPSQASNRYYYWSLFHEVKLITLIKPSRRKNTFQQFI